MERFRLYLLGPFQALLAGQPITGFESNKTRALLAYLATENSLPHTREFMAELLWPERPQGVALANLRHTLANLRTAIADHDAAQPCLLVSHQTLQFDPACLANGATFVDAARFEAILVAVEGNRLAACSQAVALYGGPFLQGFTLDGSPEFEAWLLLQRERFSHLAGLALARLVRGCIDCGSFAEGAEWSRRQLVLQPWNEEVHRQLIWLLAQSGARCAALYQYETTMRVLAEELGIPPAPATNLLAQRIREGASDLGPFPCQEGPQVELRSAAAEVGSAHGLALEATPLVGRTIELAAAAEALAQPYCRLLTILGPGGIGKTRLAREAARRSAAQFRHGAWFIDLAPASSAAALPTLLLQRLGAPDAGAADPRRRLLAYLAPKQMLLLLDNFEHLLDGAALLAEILAAAPNVKILVTSRARLNLGEEWLRPLGGLEVPPPAAVADELSTCAWLAGEQEAIDLAAFDATRLFLECVQRLQPGFAPHAHEAQLIAEICRRLEGMPLAIELAAAWTRRLSLQALDVEMGKGLQQLASPLRDAPPRHRSMATVFDQSWRLLSTREQAIMRGMSVFRGGAMLEAAAVVTGAAANDLGALVDASWLRLGRDGRYEIHELVRQYCATRLDEDKGAGRPSDEDEVRRRHCAWFGRFLSEQTRRVNYQQDVTSALLAELGNLQAAWQWGVEHGQMEMARDMALGLFYLSEMLGWYHFAIQAYAPIIGTLTTLIAAPETTPAERSGARAVLAWLEFAQCGHFSDLGLVEQSKAAAQRCSAVASSMEAGNARAEMILLSERLPRYALFATGAIEAVRQDTERNAHEFASSSAEFTLYGNELGRKFWLAHSYADLARCHWHLGNYAEAERLWQQAIALREQMGEQRFCAFNLAEYGRTCITLGKVADAVDLARRGLALSQAYGDQVGAAFGRMTLGVAMAAQGQWAVAAAYLQQSLAMGRQSGHRSLHVGSAVHLGRVLLARGDFTAAQASFEEAFDAAVRNGSIPYVQLAAILNSLGMAAQARGDWDLAAQYHRQALEQAPYCPACEVQDAWFGLAQVYLEQGEMVQAQALFERVAQDRATAAGTRAAAGQLLAVGIPPVWQAATQGYKVRR
ncbi:MAG: tetratricopeptide repeat protein [Caldilineaceae bacterium]